MPLNPPKEKILQMLNTNPYLPNSCKIQVQKALQEKATNEELCASLIENPKIDSLSEEKKLSIFELLNQLDPSSLQSAETAYKESLKNSIHIALQGLEDRIATENVKLLNQHVVDSRDQLRPFGALLWAATAKILEPDRSSLSPPITAILNSTPPIPISFDTVIARLTLEPHLYASLPLEIQNSPQIELLVQSNPGLPYGVSKNTYETWLANPKQALKNPNAKNCRAVVLAAVLQDGRLLIHASEALKNDKEVVLTAIQTYPPALEEASEALKNNKEVILAAIQTYGLALQFASEALQKDKEIVLAAVKQNEQALKYANELLKNDRDFVLDVVKQKGRALRYVREAFKNDKDVVLAAVNQEGLVLQHASEALKNNKEIVLAAVKQNGEALQYTSEALKNDIDVVLAAVEHNDLSFRHAGRKCVLLIVECANGLILQHANKVFQNDKEIVLAAVKQNSEAFQFASKPLQNDPEIRAAAGMQIE